MPTKIINQTKEMEAALLKRLYEYFEEYGRGECIAQSDGAHIEALDMLCEMADEIIGEENFIWEEDE